MADWARFFKEVSDVHPVAPIRSVSPILQVGFYCPPLGLSETFAARTLANRVTILLIALHSSATRSGPARPCIPGSGGIPGSCMILRRPPCRGKRIAERTPSRRRVPALSSPESAVSGRAISGSPLVRQGLRNQRFYSFLGPYINSCCAISGSPLVRQAAGSYPAGVEPMGTAGTQQACTAGCSRHALNPPVRERRLLLRGGERPARQTARTSRLRV